MARSDAYRMRWAGSKRQLVPKLSEYWGSGYSRYVEPFAGSAALFFALKPAVAVLSDLNAELMITYRSTRSQPELVFALLHSIAEGKTSYLRLRRVDPSQLTGPERAARFLFLNRFCFNGLYRTNLAGQFNVPYSATRTGKLPDWNRFLPFAQSLKSAQLIHADFETVIDKHVKEGDFVYLDPPYALANRRLFRQYGSQTFGLDDLDRLSKSLRLIARRGAHFVLSYAYCREAMAAFCDWKLRRVHTQRNISGFASHRRRSVELIATNISLE